jgi:hypothetical protein
MAGPTLKTDEFQHKGFGDNWNRRETLAFFLTLMEVATHGFLLQGLFIAGSLVLAYGVASIAHASLPYIFVYEGIALIGSLLLWQFYRQWIGNQQSTAASLLHITQVSSPPALHLNTPYTIDKLTVTIHSFRKRHAFRPIPHGSVPEGQEQPNTWFVEFACTLNNTAKKDALVWAQLEEVMPDNAEPHTPLRLRHSLPLSEDEVADRDLASNTNLSHAQYNIVVKDTLENKFFFKLDESMNIHTMAFSLHVSRKNQIPSQKPLFTIDV